MKTVEAQLEQNGNLECITKLEHLKLFIALQSIDLATSASCPVSILHFRNVQVLHIFIHIVNQANERDFLTKFVNDLLNAFNSTHLEITTLIDLRWSAVCKTQWYKPAGKLRALNFTSCSPTDCNSLSIIL
jgi:hypothetical protein